MYVIINGGVVVMIEGNDSDIHSCNITAQISHSMHANGLFVCKVHDAQIAPKTIVMNESYI